VTRRRNRKKETAIENARIAEAISFMLDEWREAHAPLDGPAWTDGIIYARISNDRSGGRGVSVMTQVKDCLELATRLCIHVIAIWFDNDLSAYKRRDKTGNKTYNKPRPGYLALLRDLRARKGRLSVLVYHTDRLHRDNTELEEYIDVCGDRDNGVPTYAAQGSPLDLTTATGRGVARVLGSMAVMEVERMLERADTARRERAERGLWQGGPRPFGFQPHPSVQKGGDGGLDQIPAEAGAIRDGCDIVLQLDRKKGLNWIAKDWNARGLLTPECGYRGGGNPWHPETVRGVLLAPRNAGIIEYRYREDGEEKIRPYRGVWGREGDGGWGAIVSESTWKAVRRVLKDPERVTTTGPEPRWLLTGGILECAACGGGKFQVVPGNGQTGAYNGASYYRCITLLSVPEKDRGGLSVYHLSCPAVPLEAYADQIVTAMLSGPEAGRIPGITARIDTAALENRMEEISAQLEEHARSKMTVRQIEIRNEPLLAELAAIDLQLAEARKGDALGGRKPGETPADFWDRLKDEGDIIRMRAIVAMLMRIRLRPGVKGSPRGTRVGAFRPFDGKNRAEILPPDDDGLPG
jgi:DNA invertase Pin-like site-specific DNA recombinase